MRGPLLPLLLLTGLMLGHGAHRCNREPEGKISPRTPVGNRFRIQISGNQDSYVPGETYRVTLSGARHHHVTQTFTGFTLAVESEAFWGSEGANRVGNMSTLGDALTTYGLRCPNTVVQTSTTPKSEIQVLWRAPESNSGCILFRATVIEQRNVWYMDDGKLTLRMCEAVQENHDKQPEINDPCCACDEAKYELTFEGLWSRHRHPKDFPSNGWLTRFSDVIGASHTANYSFWNYGGFASKGLRQVAEHGATRMLESELKAKSQHIRTIIKARGISYPNVTGKTFAVFRVDRNHHLVSIVSMIEPSPDWIVGVSGLELCLKNCSWVESIMFNLYPWDVGTDDGYTYISEDKPTKPPERIRRITSSFPNDPRSPFFDPMGGELKALARVFLTRQRLYEKSCTDDGPGPEENSMDFQGGRNVCATTRWSGYGSCSVTCGRGVRLRQRYFLNLELAHNHKCNTELTSRISCNEQPCGAVEPNPEDDPMCKVSPWTDWTPCTALCMAHGTRSRFRTYIIPSSLKQCSVLPGAPELQHTLPCDDRDECGDEGSNGDQDNSAQECAMTLWSEWSSCSVTCGKGTRMRTRILVAPDADTRMMAAINQQRDQDTSAGPLNLKMSTDTPDCSDVPSSEQMECNAPLPSCKLTPEQAKAACLLDRDAGPCRNQLIRWYFDPQNEACYEFNYGGCHGNSNNFPSKEECEEVCQELKDGSTTTSDPLNGLKPSSQIRNDNGSWEYGLSTLPTDYFPQEHLPIEMIHLEKSRPVVDCKMSRWSAWSECSATCGRSHREKTRHIRVNPQSGGQACPKKTRKKRKCEVPPCGFDFLNQEMQSDENPTWGEAHRIDPIPGSDCVLSEWSFWSPCSMPCGIHAVRQRTRSIIVAPSSGGMPCEERIQTDYCPLLPCKD